MTSETDRILIVDDVADNTFLLQTVLEAEGYQVDVAMNGCEALNKIETTPPDLVLSDVMMPEMDGFELTQRIRQNPHLPYIPILLITGYSNLNASEGINSGADGFLHKPIDFDLLMDWIHEALKFKHEQVD